MPGLVPGIHVLPFVHSKSVDGRVKPGHDELVSNEIKSPARRGNRAGPGCPVRRCGCPDNSVRPS